MRKTLDQIGREQGTDKASDRHNYLRIYERHFAAIRDEPLALLEIGVDQGRSHRMWREYFPNARVYGLDTFPGCKEHAGDRIEIFVGDQSDRGALQDLVARTGPLDIVIDDAAHTGQFQRASFEGLYPHVKPGGFYCVEDLQTAYWGWGESFVTYLKSLLDQVIYPCPDITCGLADRRNSSDWERIQPKLTEFERRTMAMTFYSQLVVLQSWPAGEGYL